MNNQLQITGEIVAKTEQQRGTGKRGEWKLEQILIKYTVNDRYENFCAVTCWDKLCGVYKVGDIICAHISIEHREHAGRYTNNISAWHIELL